MGIRRSDRYVLREMTGPFLVSLFGLLLFIVLNLILSLSDLMVSRGVGIHTLLQLLLFKLPNLLVLALPVSGLFATFLGLGRLVHDREVIALEASGISLRRILCPLLVAAALVGVIDFGLYNWAVPSSEQGYQRVLREVIFRQGTPQIRTNTFFKTQAGQFFYVRRYDDSDQTLRGILIYDVDSQIFPEANAAVTIVTAEEGRWNDQAWDLGAGRVYGYDRDGVLIFSGTFDQLHVGLDQSRVDLLVGARTPSEMGIAELRSRIAVLRQSGQPVDELVVEEHLRGSIPVAAVVFVLFGGSASLLWGWRSRAAGVVVSLLLVGLFQGTLLWTQTLGRRGILFPSLAAWIPDLLFGLVGLLLFLRLDRLGRDVWGRLWRRWGKGLTVLLLVVGGAAVGAAGVRGQDVAVTIDCDVLSVSSDRDHVSAQGNVRLSYGETRLSADEATLDRDAGDVWRLAAAGRVQLSVGSDFSLSGDKLSARLEEHGGTVVAEEATASGFRGRTAFTNSKGEAHALIYSGATGSVAFGPAGEVASVEVAEAQVSTCECCGGAIGAQPYSIGAGRLLVYPDRLIVAFDLVVRAGGVPVFWLPVYVQPLKETLSSPLFPSVGEDALRGLFLKWDLPFYLNDRNYGAILVDYFSRFQQVGLGAILHYALGAHAGQLRVYSLPDREGDGVLDVSLEHAVALVGSWEMRGSLDYHELGTARRLVYSFSLSGAPPGWTAEVALGQSRTEEDDQVNVLERLPELTLSHSAIALGPVSLSPRLSAGWLRESEDDVEVGRSLRLDGSVDAALPSLSVLGGTTTERAGVRLSHYESGQTIQNREALSFSATLIYPGIDLGYAYQVVNGGSPFHFDRLSSTSHATWRFFAGSALSLSVAGGVDFVAAVFDPLVVTARWGQTPSLSLVVQCDLGRGTVERVTFSGRWDGGALGATWSVPFLPTAGRFDPATLTVSLVTTPVSLSCTSELNVVPPGVSRASASVEVRTPSGWGVSAGGTYVGGRPGIQDPDLSLFKDFADCLRVGVEEKAGQVWVYVSVLAFPEAVLRYAPAVP